MNVEDHRLRILWIDDCEGDDTGYMYPEDELPSEELQRYFRIVTHPDIPKPSTIRTPQDFKTCFGPFLDGDGVSDMLPPELIAMDYVLKKWRGAKVQVVPGSSKTIPPSLRSSASRPAGLIDGGVNSGKEHESAGKFEGLVLGVFIGSLLHDHPIGMVPMTNYGDLLEDIAEVRALHQVSREVLHIDYSEFGTSGEDRSWETVLKKGVKALRARIEDLYARGRIVLSPSDLMALATNAKQEVLTLRSIHALRKLPVQGLFIDVPAETRVGAIKKWATDLLETVMVDCEELRQAEELSSQVWAAYSDDELVNARKNLSLLSWRKENDKPFDQGEYDRLHRDFGIAGLKAKKDTKEIRSTGEYSPRVRRWAALLISLNMLKRLILIQKQVDSLRVSDFAHIYPTGPVLTADDLFLAMFPIAESPIILPWHAGKSLDKSSSWMKAMLKWSSQKEGEGEREVRDIGEVDEKGDLALDIHNMLAGKGWTEQGPYGLTESERLVLRGFALEHEDLTEADWKANNSAKLVLWGSQQEAIHV